MILLALAAAAGLSGCGGAAGDAGGNGARVAASPGANVAGPAPAAGGANQIGPAGGAAVSPSPSAAGGATQPSANLRGGGRGGDAQQAKAPAPQIGSGGNDFSLFTQARGALNSDAELKAANITVEVKEGVVTLSGALASDGQKSKAERLVRAVGGVKDVKNQLRVSGGA